MPQDLPLFPLRARIHHRNGGVYEIVGLPTVYRLESTGEPAYAYREVDGTTVWVRSAREMEDGRYERLP